jgi:hypothetical protein
MERRKFIQVGTVIAASTLVSFVAKKEFLDKDDEGLKRDNYYSFSQPILKAIAIGLNAPSAHNTQPWKFKILSDTEALLYIDETKLLLDTDPPTRQIHISGGCFLEALAIGCTGIGFEATIALLPESEYTIHDIGKKAIATIKLTENKTQVKHPLWEFIFQRKMNRSVYKGEIISNKEFAKILQSTDIQYSKTVFVNKIDEMVQYNTIFRNANEVEANTLATNEETRRMFRFSDKIAATKRDGITFRGNGIKGFKKLLAQAFTKDTKESWNSRLMIDKGVENFNNGLDSSKGFVMFITTENNFETQIQHGRDMYRFCLALTKYGLFMHPLNQANEEFIEMQTHRLALDKLVGIKGNEKIQIIARIGRADEPYQSYRKHVEDFMIKNS